MTNKLFCAKKAYSKVCDFHSFSVSLQIVLQNVLLLSSFLLLSVPVAAEDSLPVIEVKADRTLIYPQRMELEGEETLMDILQMMPSLMIAGYEDVITNYNLRIDNCAINVDTRLMISQMKAKDIAKIQVCDNTGVAKGTIGMNKVLDIYLKMPDAWQGFVEGQGAAGKKFEGIATANALYGSKHTDLFANISYRHQDVNEEYLSLHMTNRFDDRNRLLTFFTQQYLDRPSGTSRKVMGRARFFHTFNDRGTELLLVSGYHYASDLLISNKQPMFIAELNTPLLSDRLSMMLGVEGCYLMTSLKDTDWKWNVINHDIYLQFTYSLPKWRLTIGNRVMFYNYKLMDASTCQRHADVRDNANANIIYIPDNRNQIHLGYFRKYYNPVYEAIAMESNMLSDEQWAITRGKLEERTIHQTKLSHVYSRQKLTVQTEASYYIIEDGENFMELGASAYWKTNWMSMTGGTNLYTARSETYASFRLAPTAFLPHQWQIGAQIVYYTKKSPRREVTGVPVYGCLSVSKQFGRKWNLSVDWHDMFDASCSDALVNRHAVNMKLQYRF